VATSSTVPTFNEGTAAVDSELAVSAYCVTSGTGGAVAPLSYRSIAIVSLQISFAIAIAVVAVAAEERDYLLAELFQMLAF